MSANILVTSPYQPFTLPNKFGAVFAGFVWCGKPDSDPFIKENQVPIYVVNEDGSRVQVSQPIRTNSGGFLVYNGFPSKFVTDSDCSLLVHGSNNEQIWYSPRVSNVDPQSMMEIISSQLFESLRRSYAEASLTLVPGSFERGGVITKANDVLLQESTGKAFSGPLGSVTPGTIPIPDVFKDMSNSLLSSKLRTDLSYFGVVNDIASSENTNAIEAAFNSGIPISGSGKYIATRPIVLSNKFDFDSMLGVSGAKFYVNGDFEFFRIDESAQFKTQGSSIKGFEFGATSKKIGFGVKSNEWAPLWTISDGVFQPTLKTAWDAPIILSKFQNVLFVDNGEYHTAIFDGSTTPPPPAIGENRIQNANFFERVRFRSENDKLSSVSCPVIFRLGTQNVWIDCEFGSRGGTTGWIEVGASASMLFGQGCWMEGISSNHFVVCTTNGGFRPTQISFINCHLAPKSGMISWVLLSHEDGGDYDTACIFEGCDEEATGVSGVELTYNKSTGAYNTSRSLPHVANNWFYYKKRPIDGVIDVPLTRGFYHDKIVSRGLSVKVNAQFPVISLSGGTAENFLLTGNTSSSSLTIRSDTNTGLNYQMDSSAHYPGFDNQRSSGKPTSRWSVIYSGTNTISTSDRREKTEPKEIDDLLLDAWGDVRIIAFKWLDSVSKKGFERARIHSGVIAQQIFEALREKGIDAKEYALLCYDKWDDVYEPEVLFNVKNDGSIEAIETGRNIISVPAGDRWGIRAEQVLFVEAAYLRRRLDRIELRLSAIEGKNTNDKL